jgi:hypothetical protein
MALVDSLSGAVSLKMNFTKGILVFDMLIHITLVILFQI